MRLAFSGSASVGKSTLHKFFRQRWPMYVCPSKTYREIITENGLEHSSKTTEETQLKILDWMMQESKRYDKDSYVVYDRCVWDNLAYTLHGNSKGQISDEVTAATISLAREAMRDLDIIFWIPFNEQIQVEDDGMRDTNLEYIKEVDNIFKDLYNHYMNNLEQDLFYPKEDCPAVIPIDENFLSLDDRLYYVSEFVDSNGDLVITENSVLDPENMELMEDMLQEQLNMQEEDKKILDIKNQNDRFNS